MKPPTPSLSLICKRRVKSGERHQLYQTHRPKHQNGSGCCHVACHLLKFLHVCNGPFILWLLCLFCSRHVPIVVIAAHWPWDLCQHLAGLVLTKPNPKDLKLTEKPFLDRDGLHVLTIIFIRAPFFLCPLLVFDKPI